MSTKITKAIDVRCPACEAKCVGMVLRGGGFHIARPLAAAKKTKEGERPRPHGIGRNHPVRQHVLNRHDTERDLLRRWEQLAKANAALRAKNRRLRQLADDAIATVDSMNAAIQEL